MLKISVLTFYQKLSSFDSECFKEIYNFFNLRLTNLLISFSSFEKNTKTDFLTS